MMIMNHTVSIKSDPLVTHTSIIHQLALGLEKLGTWWKHCCHSWLVSALSISHFLDWWLPIRPYHHYVSCWNTSYTSVNSSMHQSSILSPTTPLLSLYQWITILSNNTPSHSYKIALHSSANFIRLSRHSTCQTYATPMNTELNLSEWGYANLVLISS